MDMMVFDMFYGPCFNRGLSDEAQADGSEIEYRIKLSPGWPING